MSRHIHIICFDVPFPPDHGGMFDLFNKIVSLHKIGISITLHCFEYGRGPQNELKKYCARVFYYKRKSGITGFRVGLPYIVSSRINSELEQNLSLDNDTILLEGTHCTYILHKNSFPGRKIIFRLHNIEHIYYKHLGLAEKNLFKKIYYRIESRLLKKYEKKIAVNALMVLTVSAKDADEFHSYCPGANVTYLPVFLPFQEIKIYEGTGMYCLYHGNLSIAENEEAAIQIIKNFNSDMPLMIAGRNPSQRLKNIAGLYGNINLVANPSDKDLLALIQQAQINIVFSLNSTGIKLKLLNAVFHGRHCIINQSALSDDVFKSCCCIVYSADELSNAVSFMQKKPFTAEDIKTRKLTLTAYFNNEINAQKLSGLL